MFVEMWDEGENSFQNDPPNAVLAFLEPGDDMPEDVVIEIRNPRLEGVEALLRLRDAGGGHARVRQRWRHAVIGPFGRPLSPMSAA
jgi:hypothetical protein